MQHRRQNQTGTGKTPAGRSAGARPAEGTQGQNPSADPRRRGAGAGAAADQGRRSGRTGTLSQDQITGITQRQAGCFGINRSASFSSFPVKGALTHHPKGGGTACGRRALSEGACGSCGSLDGRETKPPCPRAFISRPYGFRRSPSETMGYGAGLRSDVVTKATIITNRIDGRNVHSDLSF